jgi:hypothetical protein
MVLSVKHGKGEGNDAGVDALHNPKRETVAQQNKWLESVQCDLIELWR